MTIRTASNLFFAKLCNIFQGYSILNIFLGCGVNDSYHFQRLVESEVEAQGFGRLQLDAEKQVTGAPTDTGATIGFRPETATILFEGQQATDRESMATVEEVVYYGDMTYYDVLLDGTSSPVRLSMRNVFGRPVLDIGTRTRVGWSPGALVLFR